MLSGWFPRLFVYCKVKLKFNVMSSVAGQVKPFVLFVLGAPGSGKGTQCSKIVEKYRFTHLSAGDLLRAERNTPGSPYGSLIEEHITGGTIVPVEITCSLIDRAITASGEKFFLVDGFPRNEDNLNGWTNTMSDKVSVLGVLFLECSANTCKQRCLDRGAAGSGRSDDNADSLMKRFKTYENDTMPIIHHYRRLNQVHTVDSNVSADKVFDNVREIIERIAPDSVN